jgi:hypothetical protein
MGTTKGAAMLDPQLETSVPAPPLPLLEQVRLLSSESPILLDKPLFHRDNSLRFDFSLPSLHRKEDTRYRTQLLGLEREPTPWREEGWREFAALPSGRFRLRIWARDFSGRQSGPVDVPFRIKPAPWFHPLAWITYVLAVGSAIWASFNLRLRWIKAQNRALEETVQARVSELLASQAEVKTLRGLVPICAYCKKIRDDKGYWEQMEQYVSQHSEARFSHGICPECRDKLMAELAPGPKGAKEQEDRP